MFLSMIGRIGVVVAFSATMAWAIAGPSSGTSQARAPRYTFNNAESGACGVSTTSAEELQNREIERLLTPLVWPDLAEETAVATTTALPKARIRDPFYDFESALVSEFQAKAAVDEPETERRTARPAAAIKRLTTKPAGYGKSTVSAAWRKLANIKRSVLFANRHNRAFRSDRWESTFDER